MYKKICRIKYNNKVFDIFDGDNHEKTFLEVVNIDGVEKYRYLNMNDYLYLNKIYNNPDISTLYNASMFIKKFALTNTMLIAFLCGIKFIDVEFKLNHNTNKYNVEVTFEPTKDIVIKNTDELEQYGFMPVSFQDVRNTLEQNQNIPDKYRIYINEYIDTLEQKLPKIDLRVFNENLKDLKFEVVANEKWDKPGVDGSFSWSDNPPTITLKEEYSSVEREKRVVTHELVHATRDTYIKIPGSLKNIQVSFFDERGYGLSINESLTDICTDYLLSDDENYFESLSRNNYDYKYSEFVYQVLINSNGYSLYDFFSYDIVKFENILRKYDMESLTAVYDVDLNTEREGIEIIDTEIYDEYNNKLLIQLCKEKIRKGESEWSIYNLPSPFTKDIIMEAYGDIPQSIDDWTIRLIDKCDCIYEDVDVIDKNGNKNKVSVVTSMKQNIDLYYDGNLIYSGNRNDICLAHTLQEENVVIRVLFKKDNLYYDIISDEIVFDDNIEFIDNFPTFGFNSYNVAINLNTLMNSDMYKELYAEDIQLYTPEYKTVKTKIKH